jgi:hypothetical protein
VRFVLVHGGAHGAWSGVVPLTIDSGYFPQLSRPQELASLLLDAVQTQSVGKLLPRWLLKGDTTL